MTVASKRAWIALASALLAGCDDEVAPMAEDSGPGLDAAATCDAGPASDAGAPLPDAGLREPCVDPGENGECALADHPARPYRVWVPTTAGDTPLPVVIALHGGSGNALAGATSTCPEGDLDDPGCLHAVGEREGFVTVYPNGTAIMGNRRIWNGGGGGERPEGEDWACIAACDEALAGSPVYVGDVDEAAYLTAVLDDLAAWVPIDRQRVYAVGLSNGGVVAHRLGCVLADRVAAIATIGASNQYATSAPCAPSRPMPVLHVHGTEDGCWRYDGGPIVCQSPDNTRPALGVIASMEGWAERNGCTGGPVTTDGPERLDDGIRVEEDRWTGCAAPTRHLRVIGGGHTWLGGRQYLAESVIGPSYPDVTNGDLWTFFAEQRLP